MPPLIKPFLFKISYEYCFSTTSVINYLIFVALKISKIPNEATSMLNLSIMSSLAIFFNTREVIVSSSFDSSNSARSCARLNKFIAIEVIPWPLSTIHKKSVVITIGSPVLGSVECLIPNSSTMTIVSSKGSKGNCSRISMIKSECSIK